MMLQTAQAYLTRIRRMAAAGHDDAAHDMQDRFFRKVLLAIARQETPDASELARLALEVDKIDFARWYS